MREECNVVTGKVASACGDDGLAFLKFVGQGGNSVLLSRLRFPKGREMIEGFLEELKNNKALWDDAIFVLKRIYKTEDGSQALKKFLKILEKWEDKDFRERLRAGWEEGLKDLIGGASKEFLGAFVKRDKEIGRVSYLKERKGLRLEFKGLGFPGMRSVYVIFEVPFAVFFGYVLYVVKVAGHSVFIDLQEAANVSTERSDAEVLRKWIEEGLKEQDSLLCFITAEELERSLLKKLITYGSFEGLGRKKLFARHAELPITYVFGEAKDDCFVIHTDGVETLKAKLGIKEEEKEHRVSLAIKPAFSDDTLQVYTIEDFGEDKDEVYEEKKNLFLLSVISISIYDYELKKLLDDLEKEV